MKRYISSAVVPSSEEPMNVQVDLAKNPRTPASVLRQLAEGDNAVVLDWVFKNPNTPADILPDLVLKCASGTQFDALLDERLPFEFRQDLAESLDSYLWVATYFTGDHEIPGVSNPTDEDDLHFEMLPLEDTIVSELTSLGYAPLDSYIEETEPYYLGDDKYEHRYYINVNYPLLDFPDLNKIINIIENKVAEAGYSVEISDYYTT